MCVSAVWHGQSLSLRMYVLYVSWMYVIEKSTVLAFINADMMYRHLSVRKWTGVFTKLSDYCFNCSNAVMVVGLQDYTVLDTTLFYSFCNEWSQLLLNLSFIFEYTFLYWRWLFCFFDPCFSKWWLRNNESVFACFCVFFVLEHFFSIFLAAICHNLVFLQYKGQL